MPIHILKPHLALNVRDLAASLAFYRKLFGLEPAKVRSSYAKFELINPPLNFTLNQNAPEQATAEAVVHSAAHSGAHAGNLSHLGFQVSSTDDVLAIRQQWHEQGLVTRDEMQTNCCFATQDKTWVEDPDGNEWEVFVVLKDNLPESSPVVAHADAPAQRQPARLA